MSTDCFWFHTLLINVIETIHLLFNVWHENCSYELDGVPRMRERPIIDLVTGLQQLGADVNCKEDNPKCPPVTINAKGGLPGGTVQ